MHGLQTLQKLNDAKVHFAREKAKTKPCATIAGHNRFYAVFEPNGYEVIYHTDNQLSEDTSPFFSIEFKGEDVRGARFDINHSDDKGLVGYMNRSLDQVVQIAAGAGLDGDEVGARLHKLFTK